MQYGRVSITDISELGLGLRHRGGGGMEGRVAGEYMGDNIKEEAVIRTW